MDEELLLAWYTEGQVILGAAARDHRWDAVRDRAVAQSPACACCGTRQKKVLQVHHIKPFHLFPELELDPRNLIVLCVVCHFLIGHLKNWSSYNPDVFADAAWLRGKIDGRPE
jgi:predicted HNH restriction endonuclease